MPLVRCLRLSTAALLFASVLAGAATAQESGDSPVAPKPFLLADPPAEDAAPEDEEAASDSAESGGEPATEAASEDPPTEAEAGADPELPVQEQPPVEEQSPAAEEAPPISSPADPDNPGQTKLDEALEIKLSAQSIEDLNAVVELIDAALEDGLDAENTDFAEQILVATLMQRGKVQAAAVLGRPIADPRRDLRWLKARQDALVDLMRAVGIDESQREAWMLIGRLQTLPLGSKSEARRAFSRVVRLAEQSADDPQADPIPPAEIAQAYALRGAAQGDAEAQLADFSRAIELAPEKAEYRLLRAKQRQAAGKPAECLEDVAVALELAPDNPKVHELRALALLMQKRPEAALESFNRATELAPKLLTPYQYRGEVYSQLGKLDDAIKQLDKALELQPNNLVSLLIRSELLTNAERYEDALADIDAVLRQQPGYIRAHLLKARALDNLDRTDEAVAWLERLASRAPNQAEVQLQLGVFYVDKQMTDKAIDALTRVVQLDGDNALARRLRGDMYLYAGKHAEALVDFDRALETDGADPGVLNNYAWTLATSPFDDVRDAQQAIEFATRACELTDYGQAHILSTLAAAHAEAGDFDEAIRRAQQAIATAEDLGTLAAYDGQLEAELKSYRDGQPWRELQGAGVSGPADEATEQLESPSDDRQEPATDEPGAEAEAPAEDPAPARSFDF
ncbi:MAG: tetratricopeptide repeat protein [Planctomycetota bacterium]